MIWLFYCFMKEFGNISHFDTNLSDKHLMRLSFLKVVVNDIIDLG